jgi:hypothetical protein
LNYAEFNKDNPFQLNEHSFNKIRKFIDETHTKSSKYRGDLSVPRIRGPYRKRSTHNPLLDLAVKELKGTRVTSVDVEVYIHPAQRPLRCQTTFMMRYDTRFLLDGKEAVGSNSDKYTAFMVVG